MVPALDKLDCGAVAGVRTYQEDERRWRRIVGLIAQLLAHLVVFRKAVCDSQCGFKLFTRETVHAVFPYCRVNGGMIDVEVFSLLHAFRIPCRFQAVHWTNKEGSRINVIRCMMLDPLDMLRIRFRHAMGTYARAVSTKDQPWSRETVLVPSCSTARNAPSLSHTNDRMVDSISRKKVA
jgi:dolichyl-phosphate beta-glucosyltransferase